VVYYVVPVGCGAVRLETGDQGMKIFPKRFSFAVTMLSTSQLYCLGIIVPVANEASVTGTFYDTIRRIQLR
jgi:hypothetical protein